MPQALEVRVNRAWLPHEADREEKRTVPQALEVLVKRAWLLQEADREDK